MNKIENILECDHIIEKRTKQTEMIKEMRENIIEVRDPYYTIRLQDMKRIANNVTNSIFDLEKCSIANSFGSKVLYLISLSIIFIINSIYLYYNNII